MWQWKLCFIFLNHFLISSIVTYVIFSHLMFYNYLISRWPLGLIILSAYRKYVSVLRVEFLPLVILFSDSIVMTAVISLFLTRHVLF